MSEPTDRPAGAPEGTPPGGQGYIPGSPRRSLAKALSWRIVGTLDTLILSFLTLTLIGPVLGLEPASHAQNAATASHIALAELVTKMALYYLHERVWERTRWNLRDGGGGRHRDGHARSVTKAASWRILASLDTTLLAFIFTGSIGAALSIGGLELITKLGLYYVHERAWARVHWGAARGG